MSVRANSQAVCNGYPCTVSEINSPGSIPSSTQGRNFRGTSTKSATTTTVRKPQRFEPALRVHELVTEPRDGGKARE